MRDLYIDEDLFFIKKDFYKANSHNLRDVLVLSEEDLFNHCKYGNVNNISNHETWGIDFDYVIVSEEGWYEEQGEEFRRKLKEETIKNGDAFLCGDMLLTKNKWKTLDPAFKGKFFKENDDDLVNTDISGIDGFDYLKKYHNVFPAIHGPNCFASVIYAISKNEDLINEWVFSNTFILFLEANDYGKIGSLESTDLTKAEDVLVIYDGANPIHAVFCLDKDMCFNKFGQTMHEAWSICEIESVLSEFEGTCIVFRKNK